jgi:hypothetical protein
MDQGANAFAPSPPLPRNGTLRSRQDGTTLTGPPRTELCLLLGQLMVRLIEAKRLKEAAHD